MAGLINQGMVSQPGAQPMQPPQQGADKVIQRIVIAATVALNQPDIEKQIIQIVQSSQDPVQGLAQALLFMMRALYEKSKGTMPKSAVGPASMQVLGVLAKMCRAAGVLKQVSPQLLQQAMKSALQMLQSQPQAPAQSAPVAAPAAAPAPSAAQPAPAGV